MTRNDDERLACMRTRNFTPAIEMLWEVKERSLTKRPLFVLFLRKKIKPPVVWRFNKQEQPEIFLCQMTSSLLK